MSTTLMAGKTAFTEMALATTVEKRRTTAKGLHGQMTLKMGHIKAPCGRSGFCWAMRLTYTHVYSVTEEPRACIKDHLAAWQKA